jgi:hypothetical protein
MKIQNPIIKSVFCAIIVTVLFFIIFNAQGNHSFNETMGILIGIPITFICTFVYCCIILFLEQVKIIAPNFLCRFAVPFSSCCLLSILYCIFNNIQIVDYYQQFSFVEYWQELTIPFLVLFTINMLIAVLFSMGNEEAKANE